MVRREGLGLGEQGFRVQGAGFGVWGQGSFREVPACMVEAQGSEFQGLGCEAWGLGTTPPREGEVGERSELGEGAPRTLNPRP